MGIRGHALLPILNPHARAHRPQRRAPGFTLIEILVVVVIISVLVTVALLSINVLGRDSEITEETRRLRQLIAAVREQAEMQGRDFGLRFHVDGYEFLRHEARRERWVPAGEDPLLRARALPAGLIPRLYLEGREIVLKPRPEALDEAQEQEKSDEEDDDEARRLAALRAPQVFILANGDMTAFELILEREGTRHTTTLIGEVDGTVEVKSVDEAPE